MAMHTVYVLYFVLHASNFIKSISPKLFPIEDQARTVYMVKYGSDLVLTQERNYELNQLYTRLLVLFENNLVFKHKTAAAICIKHVYSF